MLIVTPILVALLYAAAFYMLLARRMVKLIFGLVVLGHAANLLIFAAGGLVRAAPAIVPPESEAPPAGYADPIPQALVLTAIVIGFSILAFAAVLIRRVYDETATDDTEAMRTTET